MYNVIEDILSVKNAGKKVGETIINVCPICGSEIYIIDGEPFYTCDCDKVRPVELSNV